MLLPVIVGKLRGLEDAHVFEAGVEEEGNLGPNA